MAMVSIDVRDHIAFSHGMPSSHVALGWRRELTSAAGFSFIKLGFDFGLIKF